MTPTATNSPTNDTRTPLPWADGVVPLMLAPMQGLTNRAMRALFIQRVRPDTVFTEFVRVNPVASKRHIAAGDLREMAAVEEDVPLVVQLIGHGPEALASAAEAAQRAGAVHLNLNLGCPYGRMTTGLTGGGMLSRPEVVREIIPALRRTVTGTFSVKLRAGYDDLSQVFSLLPLFEECGVDFLVLHPRTVVQEYRGAADHTVTAEVVRRTHLPVIANGDIRSAAGGKQILEETGAAGLMLGRGAIADPLLFLRLRGKAAAEPGPEQRAAELQAYLRELLERYRQVFCGDTQVLNKIKGVFATMDDPDLAKEVRRLQRATSLPAFTALLDGLHP